MVYILPVELINNFTKRLYDLPMSCHVSGQDQIYDPLSDLFKGLWIHIGKDVRLRLWEDQYEKL